MSYLFTIYLLLFSSLTLASPPKEYFYDRDALQAYTTNTLACEANKQLLQLQFPSANLIQDGNCPTPAGSSFNVTFFNQSNGNFYNLPVYSRYVCDGKSTSFNADNVASSFNCPDSPPPPDCGSKIGDKSLYYTQRTSSGGCPSSYCINGCTYSREGLCGLVTALGSTDGTGFVGVGLGTSCTQDGSAPKTNDPAGDCLRAGKSFGTVNGVTVCVKAGTAGSAPVSYKPPPVVTTTTPPPTTTNPNPTPVKTSTPQPEVTITPAPAGSSQPPTITTGGTAPDGTKTETSSDKDTFCQTNPNSPLCKTKSACESDPESAACMHLCEKFPNSVGCKDANAFIGSGTGSDGVDIPTKTVDTPTFSAISMPSNNSCPANQTMSIHGIPITVSFDWICQYASAFKALVIAFSLFAAAVMVTGAVRADSQPYQRGLF